MEKRDIDVLRDALKNKHRDESFERALGRAVRKDRGDYKRYIDIMGEIREFARSKRVNVIEAARMIIKN